MDLFLISYLQAGVEKFCIWYQNDKDGFCKDDHNKILSFANKEFALIYLSKRDLCLYEGGNISSYDFDKLNHWINSTDSNVDCNELLEFWNMFSDSAYTTIKKFVGDNKNKTTNLIYDKLFFGCNLPAIKPDGEEDYVPIWNEKQITILKSIMKGGVNIFLKNLANDPVI